MNPFTKLKKRGQQSGGVYGNRHVNKYLKRKANRFIRLVMRREADEYTDV